MRCFSHCQGLGFERISVEEFVPPGTVAYKGVNGSDAPRSLKNTNPGLAENDAQTPTSLQEAGVAFNLSVNAFQGALSIRNCRDRVGSKN